MHILIADDDPRHRDLLGHILRKWPEHRLAFAADGEEAWTLLDDPKRGFDAVFLDLGMPKLDGLAVLARLKESPLHRSLQCVLCTARSDRETVAKALALGVRHYIVKPWSEQIIADKVRCLAEARG